LTEADLLQMGEWIQGAFCYVLQQYRPVEGSMNSICAAPHPGEQIQAWAESLHPMVARILTRGLNAKAASNTTTQVTVNAAVA
jgi:hypothetical protein